MTAVSTLDNLIWRKSSFSTGGSNGGGTCVEVALGNEVVSARDSKVPDDGTITVSHARWASFLDALRTGRFDR